MKLQPLLDWAVIRPSDTETKTAGGIIIPDTAKEKPQQGVVEAIGPGAYEEEKEDDKKKKKERKFVPTTVKPGDRVIFAKYAGQAYTLEGEEIILVRERDILGVMTDK
jgi:chaperonin GroES